MIIAFFFFCDPCFNELCPVVTASLVAIIVLCKTELSELAAAVSFFPPRTVGSFVLKNQLIVIVLENDMPQRKYTRARVVPSSG